jgi:hypothetical protein
LAFALRLARLGLGLGLPLLRPFAREGEHLANEALDGRADVGQARVVVHIGRRRDDPVLLVH